MSTDKKKTIQIFTFNNFFSANPFGFSLLATYHANPSAKLVSQALVMKWTPRENKNVENEIVLLTLSRVLPTGNLKLKFIKVCTTVDQNIR